MGLGGNSFSLNLEAKIEIARLLPLSAYPIILKVKIVRECSNICLIVILYNESSGVQFTSVISNSGILKCPVISKNIFWTHLLFSLTFQPCYLKLLVSQSKFSETRKFTLRYQ